jgi:hypothetical protein
MSSLRKGQPGTTAPPVYEVLYAKGLYSDGKLHNEVISPVDPIILFGYDSCRTFFARHYAIPNINAVQRLAQFFWWKQKMAKNPGGRLNFSWLTANCHEYAVYCLSMSGIFDPTLSSSRIPVKTTPTTEYQCQILDKPINAMDGIHPIWVTKGSLSLRTNGVDVARPSRYVRLTTGKSLRDAIVFLMSDYADCNTFIHPARHHKDLARRIAVDARKKARGSCPLINMQLIIDSHFLGKASHYKTTGSGGSFFRRIAFLHGLADQRKRA